MSYSVSVRLTGENFLLTSLLFSLASLHVSVCQDVRLSVPVSVSAKKTEGLMIN